MLNENESMSCVYNGLVLFTPSLLHLQAIRKSAYSCCRDARADIFNVIWPVLLLHKENKFRAEHSTLVVFSRVS